MIDDERDDLLTEELLLVRHSGEIPEVALHTSLYYLSSDDDGPKLRLTDEEIRQLEEAALARYQEIILRDLDPANRKLSLFRGIRRADHNWRRLIQFCNKTGRSYEKFRLLAAPALVGYLRQELAEVSAGKHQPSINCSAAGLRTFAQTIGIDPAALPAGWAGLCEQEGRAVWAARQSAAIDPLPSPVPGSRGESMQPTNGKWRVGIIGTGKHGSRYARHIVRDIEGLELVAISRRSEEGRSQAAQWACRWHADWRALVADPEVDCVIAVLPPTLNLQVATACAEAHKPLLLEKPMAVSAAEAIAIDDLFTRKGVGLTIGQTLRYNRVLSSLRHQLPSLGHLYGFTANQRLEPATLDWLDEPSLAGGGVTFHSAVHVFDGLRWITGQEIVRVLAKTRCVHSLRLEDHLVALVELANGVIGTVDCSKIGPARSGCFEFIGSQGQLHADQVHYVGESIQGQNRLVLEMGEPVSTIESLLRDWLAFLCGDRSNPIPGSEGLAAVRVCEACLRSAAQGGWVEV